MIHHKKPFHYEGETEEAFEEKMLMYENYFIGKFLNLYIEDDLILSNLLTIEANADPSSKKSKIAAKRRRH